jgi:hypothetical protein
VHISQSLHSLLKRLSLPVGKSALENRAAMATNVSQSRRKEQQE